MKEEKKPINKECGRRLKQAITISGMTQKKFAALVPCAQQHISQIVCGTRRLTPEYAKRAAEILPGGVRAEWLLCQDNFMTLSELSDYHKNQSKYYLDKLEEWEDALDNLIVGKLIQFGFNLRAVQDSAVIKLIDMNNPEVQIGEYITADRLKHCKEEIIEYAGYVVFRLITETMRGNGQPHPIKWEDNKNG